MRTAEFLHAIFPNRPFGPLPDPEEDRQWEQIHVLFGMATLWAQAYEDGLAYFVVKAEERWQRSGNSSERINKMVLGILQKEYARYCHLENHHQEDMKHVLDLRNSLAHNFYRRRMDKLATQMGREEVIEELQQAINCLQMARDNAYWNISLLTGQPAL